MLVTIVVFLWFVLMIAAVLVETESIFLYFAAMQAGLVAILLILLEKDE
jgi:hypothetical protein